MSGKDVSKSEYISVAEAASEMGYTRQHVLRLINAGKVRAMRVGRSYLVSRDSLGGVYQGMTPGEKKQIDRAVDKIFKEYGDTIKALSKE